MTLVIVHLIFAAFLVCILYALNRQGENTENLMRGLDLARKADAEAARHRQHVMNEALQEQHAKMLKMLRDAEIARKQCELAMTTGAKITQSLAQNSMPRTGNGHGVNGHQKG